MREKTKHVFLLANYMTRLEFERRFAGSIGGKAWVFAGPFLTIVVIWVALDLGLGLRSIAGGDYSKGLVIGLCGWLFFSEAVNTSVNSISAQPHLVNKIVFPVFLLPLVNIMVSFIVHLTILAIIVLFLWFQEEDLGTGVLLLPFWVFCFFIFTFAVALIVSAANVLARDASAIVPNFVSFMFWLTPVIWPVKNLNSEWAFIGYLNPIAIILEGYRSSIIGTAPLISPLGVLAFVIFLALFVSVAIFMFNKMRMHFADVM